MKITVLILTKNEEQHLERCLSSVRGFASDCVVVDSGSNDRTVQIAKNAGAKVLENPWINYAKQFNWGVDRIAGDTDWVMRLDADEIVSDDLAREISSKLPFIDSAVNGVYVQRRMCFLGKKIRWGGVFPVKVLRLFRPHTGRCEERWMDEHLLVTGETEEFDGEIVDDNKKSLTWWTEKHNAYASREVVDILNAELRFMPSETIANLEGGQAGVKRWIKENLYSKLPTGTRALLYFLYRYYVRFGFLDGKKGAIFHVLQGYWYRYLVDAKLFEVRLHMKQTGDDPMGAIRHVLGIDLNRKQKF